ncbi:helix-turn-helix transcriptional regulator [Paenibacillus filicis]|uniref:Helix-turn-helix transcriptional regulator n=1 Tax=Paenibacillus gyeongsangnamensis TaxID=3388067 RepID=A0ABT4Q2G8_9BACL|nr:helix-turn-helix transcriptional regulator [Paenibacillus filicis]MCZ8511034.1 helix-turn-helix transcriptional regulator [Paenibacillus filicis]
MQVKQIRLQRGVGVSEFALELGVTPDYLTNLENGRTRTIQLEILSKLERELASWAGRNEETGEREEPDTQSALRAARLAFSLRELHRRNPEAADSLMRIVEQGLLLFK